jgi:hypothetical protein
MNVKPQNSLSSSKIGPVVSNFCDWMLQPSIHSFFITGVYFATDVYFKDIRMAWFKALYRLGAKKNTWGNINKLPNSKRSVFWTRLVRDSYERCSPASWERKQERNMKCRQDLWPTCSISWQLTERHAVEVSFALHYLLRCWTSSTTVQYGPWLSEQHYVFAARLELILVEIRPAGRATCVRMSTCNSSPCWWMDIYEIRYCWQF